MEFLKELGGPKEAAKTEIVRKNIETYFQKAVAAKTYICWMAMAEDSVAGLGGMVIREQPAKFACPNGLTGYVMNMYTLPEYRKQGICAALLEKLTETAKEMHLHSLELHATPEGEPLYRKCGFKEPKSIVLDRVL